MKGYVTIECEAEINIDEYVEEVSDEVLASEFHYRISRMPNTDKLFNEEDLIEMMIAKRNILDAQKIRDFFKQLDNY